MANFIYIQEGKNEILVNADEITNILKGEDDTYTILYRDGHIVTGEKGDGTGFELLFDFIANEMAQYIKKRYSVLIDKETESVFGIYEVKQEGYTTIIELVGESATQIVFGVTARSEKEAEYEAVCEYRSLLLERSMRL